MTTAAASGQDLPPSGRWLRPTVADVALVGGLLLLEFVWGFTSSFTGAMVGLVQIAPLLWRRTHPGLAATVIAVGAMVQLATTLYPRPANIAVPVIVYSAAAYGSRVESLATLGAGLIGAVIGGLAWQAHTGDWRRDLVTLVAMALFAAMFVAVSWALGDVTRRRTEVTRRLEQQNRALARDQAQRTQLAAQGERAAIAREMHDVVAHSLAVVVVQADGGLYAARTVLDQAPSPEQDRAALEQAAVTLQTIAQAARGSLAETRKLVGVLRDETAGADYAPQPGLAELEPLLARVRAAGVEVTAVVRGAADDLTRDADAAAYRVIQEALTNVLKHAGPGVSVDVDVLRTPAVLLVRVTDNGRGAQASDGEGNGLLGMRERVEVLGGTVHAGPAMRGGWEVVASIPAASSTDPSQVRGSRS